MDAPSSPTRLIAGRYEVGELLGRGGMAEVFAGVDRRLGRPVAIKFLRPEMAARPDVRSRFEAEARAAASLSHPNAVGVFDTGEQDGVAFIVMERLPGETLADRIAAGPLDEGPLRTLAIEVLGALAAAHDSSLVHRDIKPANILLSADGRAKVADFGIAKSTAPLGAGGTVPPGSGDLTTEGQLLGTPAYLAPERLDGAPATPASDIWALGVVLYEALTATNPFRADTALATARAVAAGTHRPLSQVRPDVDSGLVAAVERAMATDPTSRFPSAAAMAAALVNPASSAPGDDTVDEGSPERTLLLGKGDLVEPPPLATSPRRPFRNRRLAIGAALLGLVLVVAVLIARARSDHPSTATSPATTSGAPTTTVSPSAALAASLRGTADRLGPGDGALASVLAGRLRSVADQVQAGDGGSAATSLLAATVGWIRAGQLSGATAASVVPLLASVPGINSAVVNALTTTPTTSPPTPSSPGKEKGKGRGD
ncbi:MAG: serine/threonine-protein kinase [Acidimicrobiales bacterium]